MTGVSDIDGIVWPRIGAGGPEGLRALGGRLDETQWWSPDELAAHQMQQLRRLAEHAAASTVFHADRLGPLLPADGRRPTMADLRRVPVMTRRDLQADPGAVRSNALPPSHAPVGELRSSGSSGEPVGVLSTAVTEIFHAAINRRLHRWHDKDFSAEATAIKVLRGNEPAASARDQPLRWSSAPAGGDMYVFEISRPVSEQLAWLREHDPVYLLTYPSNLRDLLRRSRDAGYRPARLRAINTMSETLDPELRALCRSVWQVPIVDAYSAIECGMIALQCPEHDHYHVQSENVIVEVVDDRGNPCGPGEHGRALVTDLHNFAEPIIRYEIGDYVTVGGPCPCGRGLPVLDRILGRSRNMVRYPDGDSAWPMAWSSGSMAEITDIRGIQLVQHSFEEIEVRLVVAEPLTQSTETELVAYFAERLGHPFRFRFVYLDRLERLPGGKFEDFMCRVP